MHVVLLNQAFHPDVVATAQMSKDLADHLVARGHTVSAVASRSIYGKSGAVLPKRETIDGIEVYRVGSSIFGKAGIAARLADFGLFYLLSTWRTLTLKKPDVVVSFTTPPFIGLAGLGAKLFRGSKSVYWVMDLYPDVAVACGYMKAKSPITGFFEWLNRLILKRSDTSVVLGRCMQDRVLAKGAPADRIEFIPVWADTSGIEPVEHEGNPYRTEWDLDGTFCVMYSGNFGLGHECETICRAMKRIQDEPARDAEGKEIPIKFVFVGGGKRRSRVEEYIKDEGITIARYEDYQPREKIGQSLSAADAHLISIREGVEGLIVPSKLLGIMAAARASIYVGDPSSEIARVLDETDSGVLLREGDDASLAAAIRELAADPSRAAEMGKRARDAMMGTFDMTSACDRWADLLEKLVPASPAAAPGRTTS